MPERRLQKSKGTVFQVMFRKAWQVTNFLMFIVYTEILLEIVIENGLELNTNNAVKMS